MVQEFDAHAFEDPDRAVQVEDDDPEALAGEAVAFDADDDAADAESDSDHAEVA